MYGFVQFAMLLVYSCEFLTVCAKAFAVRAGSLFDDVYNDVVCGSLTCQLSTTGHREVTVKSGGESFSSSG